MGSWSANTNLGTAFISKPFLDDHGRPITGRMAADLSSWWFDRSIPVRLLVERIRHDCGEDAAQRVQSLADAMGWELWPAQFPTKEVLHLVLPP